MKYFSRTEIRLFFAQLFLGFGTALQAAESASAQWPQFRGPNAAGVGAVDARPPVKIGPSENVLWKVEVPWSPSSPIVWGDRLILTTFHQGQLETRCYDSANGRLRWAKAVKPEELEVFHGTDGSPAASTPATNGKQVVSYFGSFGLICYELKDGRELWRHPLPTALSGGGYGSGTSPIIAGDLAILNRDQDKGSSLLAVDLNSGKSAWEVPRPDSRGSFSTPIIWKNNSVDEVVLPGTLRIKGFDLKTGAERWVVEGTTGFACPTPVIGDGLLFFAGWSPGASDSRWPPWPAFLGQNDKNGDGEVPLTELPADRRDFSRGLDLDHDGRITKADWDVLLAASAKAQNVMVAVRPGGRGDITDSHVAWKYTRGLPYVPSPLFYDGRVYLVKDGGMFTSLDAMTGNVVFAQQRLGALGSYYASPVAADGRIYLASLPGKLSVVKAGGDKPEILHQADFGERIFATPAIVGNRIYLRTEKHLWALGEGR
jgi:outer membrane protein assembly factor BamB